MNRQRNRSPFIQSDEGSALIEFSASATLLLMVIFGIMEVGRAFYVANFVSNATPEALRYATVRGQTWNGTPCTSTSASACTATSGNVAAYLNTLAPLGVSTSANYLTVTTTWPGTTPTGAVCSSQGVNNAPGCIVKVNVAYSFRYIFPFMPKQALALSSTSAMVISQ